ncbi:MAG: OmpA family protein [Pseudomonadota bacterium]
MNKDRDFQQQRLARATRRCLLVLGFAGVLSACATSPDVDVPSSQRPLLPPPPPPTEIPGQDTAVGTVQPVPPSSSIDSGLVSGEPITRSSINDPSHPLARRIIFFDYNSASIGDESINLLEQHAQYLGMFRDVRVRLEGHTDERGSREYNIALGDNRSRSVARVLQLQGVDAGQFSTLSYGEEVPLDEGTGENAWRRNRRVEIVYEGLN